MRIIEAEQGSEAWLAARMGKATTSEFSRIITAVGGEPSKSMGGYAEDILAEMIVGHPIEGFQSDYMKHGKDLEADAALQYASLTDMPVIKVGFCVTDDDKYGSSPDRLVGDEGLLETKVLKPGNQVAQFLKPTLEKDHKPQTQGQLFVTGRKWVDVMSYHPEMKPVIIRVERDTSYIFEMVKCLAEFDKIFQEKKRILIEKGHLKP